jgi:hypothetical protein
MFLEGEIVQHYLENGELKRRSEVFNGLFSINGVEE